MISKKRKNKSYLYERSSVETKKINKDLENFVKEWNNILKEYTEYFENMDTNNVNFILKSMRRHLANIFSKYDDPCLNHLIPLLGWENENDYYCLSADYNTCGYTANCFVSLIIDSEGVRLEKNGEFV